MEPAALKAARRVECDNHLCMIHPRDEVKAALEEQEQQTTDQDPRTSAEVQSEKQWRQLLDSEQADMAQEGAAWEEITQKYSEDPLGDEPAAIAEGDDAPRDLRAPSQQRLGEEADDAPVSSVVEQLWAGSGRYRPERIHTFFQTVFLILVCWW